VATKVVAIRTAIATRDKVRNLEDMAAPRMTVEGEVVLQ
jgi:hypothetical protein